ncbi:MAG: nitroreductase family protein [Clostridia bacterium]|nr:nitroreductase family protein [Clostridia bacterium]
MNVIDAIKTRQSCRNFNGEKPPLELLNEIAELALLCPSACNSQPWKIYLVYDNEKVEEVAKSTQDLGMNKFASNAGAFFVVADQNAKLMIGAGLKFDQNHFVKYDVGELIAYLTLLCKEKGLETCILGWVNDKKLKNAVNYSDNEVCNVVIAVGYSDIPLRKKVRKPASEKIVVI